MNLGAEDYLGITVDLVSQYHILPNTAEIYEDWGNSNLES